MIQKENIKEENLRNMYETDMSQQKIANFYGVSQYTIWKKMKDFGIKARPSIVVNQTRKHHINTKFFKIWTKESAWIYGWFLGDANYSETCRIKVELSRKSEEVLYKFKEILESEHDVKRRTRRNSYNHYIDSSYIQFFSKELADDLRRLSYAEIPVEHLSDFFRGFFEAEGCVEWSKNKIIKKGGAIKVVLAQNDINILKFIQFSLSKSGIISGGSLYKNKNGLCLQFGIEDSVSFYHYIYDNPKNLFLSHKKDKFEELIRRHLA